MNREVNAGLCRPRPRWVPRFFAGAYEEFNWGRQPQDVPPTTRGDPLSLQVGGSTSADNCVRGAAIVGFATWPRGTKAL
jgi:hypothetical protein